MATTNVIVNYSIFYLLILSKENEKYYPVIMFFQYNTLQTF